MWSPYVSRTRVASAAGSNPNPHEPHRDERTPQAIAVSTARKAVSHLSPVETCGPWTKLKLPFRPRVPAHQLNTKPQLQAKKTRHRPPLSHAADASHLTQSSIIVGSFLSEKEAPSVVHHQLLRYQGIPPTRPQGKRLVEERAVGVFSRFSPQEMRVRMVDLWPTRMFHICRPRTCEQRAGCICTRLVTTNCRGVCSQRRQGAFDAFGIAA